jgi:hypothetical protein
LRKRDPKTGKRRETTEGEAVIQSIDVKGTYGLGINWKDRKDIFTFDVLQDIVDEAQKQ